MKTNLTHLIRYVITSLIIAAAAVDSNGQRNAADECATIEKIGGGIGSSLDNFAKVVQSAGFGAKKTKEDDGLTLLDMTGRIGNLRRCKLLTAANNEHGRTVHHAMIFMQERAEWSELKADYDKMKESLRAVYGEPKEIAESFTGKEPQDDKERMEMIKSDKADFTTKYERGELTVMLSMTYTAEHGAHVGMLFIDKQVSELILGTLERK